MRSWAVEICCHDPASVGAIAWRKGGHLRVTVVLKACFNLGARGALTISRPLELRDGDQHYGDDRARPICAPCDLAPYLDQAEILFAGAAHAYGGAPGPVGARLAVARGSAIIVDKRVTVHAGEEGAGLEPPEWGAWLRERSWPHLVTASLPTGIIELSEAHHALYFQSAPADQRLESLAGGDQLLLESLHPDNKRLVLRVPTTHVNVEAQLEQVATAVAMRCQTAWVDTQLNRCALIWRGSFAVANPNVLKATKVVAAFEVAAGSSGHRRAAKAQPADTGAAAQPARPSPPRGGGEAAPENLQEATMALQEATMALPVDPLAPGAQTPSFDPRSALRKLAALPFADGPAAPPSSAVAGARRGAGPQGAESGDPTGGTRAVVPGELIGRGAALPFGDAPQGGEPADSMDATDSTQGVSPELSANSNHSALPFRSTPASGPSQAAGPHPSPEIPGAPWSAGSTEPSAIQPAEGIDCTMLLPSDRDMASGATHEAALRAAAKKAAAKRAAAEEAAAEKAAAEKAAEEEGARAAAAAEAEARRKAESERFIKQQREAEQAQIRRADEERAAKEAESEEVWRDMYTFSRKRKT